MLLNFIYDHTLTTDRTLCITTMTHAYLDNSTASATAVGIAQWLQSPSMLHMQFAWRHWTYKIYSRLFQHQPRFSCLLTNIEDKSATQLQLETGHKSRIQILVGRYTQDRTFRSSVLWLHSELSHTDIKLFTNSQT